MVEQETYASQAEKIKSKLWTHFYPSHLRLYQKELMDVLNEKNLDRIMDLCAKKDIKLGMFSKSAQVLKISTFLKNQRLGTSDVVFQGCQVFF
jgi:hypothetical protein